MQFTCQDRETSAKALCIRVGARLHLLSMFICTLLNFIDKFHFYLPLQRLINRGWRKNKFSFLRYFSPWKMAGGSIFQHWASPFDNICQWKWLMSTKVNSNFPFFPWSIKILTLSRLTFRNPGHLSQVTVYWGFGVQRYHVWNLTP